MSGPAPVLLRNGTVYSPADPFATAMVVEGGVVAWVGSDAAADGVAGPGVPVVDLAGALVTPAFVDAHVHLTDTGLAASGVDLSGTRSAAEVLARVDAAARARPGLPVLGHGWDDSGWAEPGPPTREQLDQASGGAVVYLSRVDVHSALVSTALLDRIAGVASLDGFRADGLLVRAAHHRARRASRDTVTPGQRRALQQEALRAAAAVGVGQVHEMAAPHIAGLDDLALLLEWTAHADDVPRVVGYWGELDGVAAALSVGAHGCAGDLCLDGSLGSRTAALSQPYDDRPDAAGTLYLDPEQVRRHVAACARAGLQAGFHCIGDAAVRAAVDGIEAAAAEGGASGHRLEHVEMVDADLAARMAALGVTASVQPAFDAAWGGPDGMYAQRLGEQRAAGLNPFALLARSGVTLALGSDSPVTPVDPWGGVRAAALHRTPEHAISVRAAFSAHTRGGWRAAGLTGGVLAPGMPADYVVWDVPGDLVVQTPDERVAAWSTDPRSGVPGLPDLAADAPPPRCLRTVVAGRTIFAAQDSSDTPVGPDTPR